MKMLEPGQEIQSKIVAISDDCIFLDLNAKSEGILDRSELTDENGNLTVKEGDIVSAFFLKSENGEMYFTTKIGSRKADSSMLENAFHSHIPVEGHVEKEIKGGFEIKIGDVRAFCPYSQMGYRQKEEPQNYIGKIIPFIITEYRENGKNLLVSNRRYLEEEHLKKIENPELLYFEKGYGEILGIEDAEYEAYGSHIASCDEVLTKEIYQYSIIHRARNTSCYFKD